MIQIKGSISLEDFQSIVFENQQFTLSDSIWEKIEESYKFLTDFAENKVIYGVNTGFGPMAQYKINDWDRNQLQYST